jgi:hypothetical protein
MAAGTPTLSDSFNLSNSAIFKGRVQISLVSTCMNINSEAISGTMPLALHLLRKNQVAQILNPANFSTWVSQFALLAAANATVVSDATTATTNYVPITTSTGDTVQPNIPDTDINNAVSAAFNAVIPGV